MFSRQVKPNFTIKIKIRLIYSLISGASIAYQRFRNKILLLVYFRYYLQLFLTDSQLQVQMMCPPVSTDRNDQSLKPFKFDLILYVNIFLMNCNYRLVFELLVPNTVQADMTLQLPTFVSIIIMVRQQKREETNIDMTLFNWLFKQNFIINEKYL